MKNYIRSKEFLWTTLAFIVLIIIYYKHVIDDPFTGRDDYWILTPLFQINTLADFISYYYDIGSPDIQPIRDISLIIDIIINRTTGLSTYHLQNLIIWLLTFFLIFISFKKYVTSKNNYVLTSIILLMICAHPIVTSSIGWISARKHLLATFFIIWTFVQIIKNNGKLNYKVFTLYLLSVFSQPIMILFPLWYLAYSIIYRKESFKKEKIYLFQALMLLAIFINYKYYNLYYLQTNQTSKIETLHFNFSNEVIDCLMKFGNYFFLILIPNNLTIYYNYNYIKSYAGILFFLFILYIFIKKYGVTNAILFISLVLLPLLIPIIKIKIILINDTYLLIPICLLIVGFAYLFKDFENSKIKVSVLIGVVISMIALSIIEAKQWLNQEELWQKNFTTNPNCESSASYALILYDLEKIEEAKIPAYYHFQNNCFILNKSYKLFILSIFNNKNIPLDQKITSSKKFSNTPFGSLTLSIYSLIKGNRDESLQYLLNLKNRDLTLLKHIIPKNYKKLLLSQGKSINDELSFWIQKHIE